MGAASERRPGPGPLASISRDAVCAARRPGHPVCLSCPARLAQVAEGPNGSPSRTAAQATAKRRATVMAPRRSRRRSSGARMHRDDSWRRERHRLGRPGTTPHARTIRPRRRRTRTSRTGPWACPERHGWLAHGQHHGLRQAPARRAGVGAYFPAQCHTCAAVRSMVPTGPGAAAPHGAVGDPLLPGRASPRAGPPAGPDRAAGHPRRAGVAVARAAPGARPVQAAASGPYVDDLTAAPGSPGNGGPDPALRSAPAVPDGVPHDVDRESITVERPPFGPPVDSLDEPRPLFPRTGRDRAPSCRRGWPSGPRSPGRSNGQPGRPVTTCCSTGCGRRSTRPRRRCSPRPVQRGPRGGWPGGPAPKTALAPAASRSRPRQRWRVAPTGRPAAAAGPLALAAGHAGHGRGDWSPGIADVRPVPALLRTAVLVALVAAQGGCRYFGAVPPRGGPAVCGPIHSRQAPWLAARARSCGVARPCRGGSRRS